MGPEPVAPAARPPTGTVTGLRAAPRLEVRTRSAGQTRELARRLGERLLGGDVVVLTGDLGAGKTTFTQGLAVGLGVTSPVTSPTFVLARHQRNDPTGPRPGGPDLVHVDAYRLHGALELDDLDLDSDLATSVVVVEWGEGLAERLSPDRVEVRLSRAAGGASDGPDPAADPGEPPEEPRTVDLHVVGGLGRELLAGLSAALPDPTPSEPETPC